jgi:membrane protein YqaA with SNARE-associated domain
MKKFLALLAAWGLPGIFLVTLADGAGVPNPSGPDVILLLYCSQRPGHWLSAALLAILGSVIGSQILYEIARKGGELYLRRRLDSSRGKKVRDWYHRYGAVTLFIPALVPIPMPLKAFEICSGALKLPRWTYALTIVLARLPRYLAFAWIGRGLHEEPLRFLKHHTLDFIWIALATLVLCLALIRWADRHADSANLPDPQITE